MAHIDMSRPPASVDEYIVRLRRRMVRSDWFRREVRAAGVNGIVACVGAVIAWAVTRGVSPVPAWALAVAVVMAGMVAWILGRFALLLEMFQGPNWWQGGYDQE